MTFDEWFYGIENFSLRAERFYNEIDPDSRIDSKVIVSWLKAAYEVGAEHAQTYKDGYDAAMRIVKSTYPDKFPDTYFICGEGGEKDQNNLPKRIHVCPAYGVDFFVVYTKTDQVVGPEW